MELKEEIIYTEKDNIFSLYSAIKKRWENIPEPKEYKPHVDILDILWKGVMPVRGTVGSRYSEDYVKARFLPSIENPYDANMFTFINRIIHIYGEPSDHQRRREGSMHYKIRVGDSIVKVVLAFDHIEASRKETKYKKSRNS